MWFFSSILNSENWYEATENDDRIYMIIDNILNSDITKEEVLNVLKLSKAGKYPGFDKI